MARPVTAAEATALLAPEHWHWLKTEIESPDAVLTDMRQLGGVDWQDEVNVRSDFDKATIAFSLKLRLDTDTLSLAPTMGGSTLNRDSLDAYKPFIDLARDIRVYAAVTPPGSEPGGSYPWREVVRGVIDEIDWGGEAQTTIELQCRDEGAKLQAAQIRTTQVFGSETGELLEDVLRAMLVAAGEDPDLLLHVPSAPPALVFEFEQAPGSLLDAMRERAEQIGWDLRYRYDAAHVFRLTLLEPPRDKVVPDWDFGPADYDKITRLKIGIADVLNVVEVEFRDRDSGERDRVEARNQTSIDRFGGVERWGEIVEDDDSIIDSVEEAQDLADAAVHDLGFPWAEQEVEMPLFWPVQEYDLARFQPNFVHYDDAQDLGIIGYTHTWKLGHGTTKLLTRGVVSGSPKVWTQRRVSPPRRPGPRVSNFHEIGRTDTTVKFGFGTRGAFGPHGELWLYLATPPQPVSDGEVDALLQGVPTTRLTPATDEIEVPIPDAGLVTYGRLVPIGPNAVRGTAFDFTVQGSSHRLLQRATIQSTSATQVVVRVAVANPIAGGDITIAYDDGGLTVTPASGQTIASGSVTAVLSTTGFVDFTITRPAFGTGTGRVTFTATSPDREADVDAVDVPAVEQLGVQYVQCIARITDSNATTVTVTVTATAAEGTPTVGFVGVTGSATKASGHDAGTYTHAQNGTDNVWVFNRGAINAGAGQAQFRAVLAGFESDDDLVTIEEQGRDTVALLSRARVTSTSATQVVVRLAVADPFPQGTGTVTVTYQDQGSGGVSPASGGTLTPAATLTEAENTYIDYTITRPDFGTATGRVTFTATAANRTSDSDAVDVPAQERDTVSLLSRARVTATAATTITVRVAVADPYPQGTDSATITYQDQGSGGVSPASGGTVTPAATLAEAAGTFIDYTITRPAAGQPSGRVTFTVAAANRTSDSDAVDVPAVETLAPQGTVSVDEDGAWAATGTGQSVASWLYLTSTSAFPSRSSVLSGGTLVNDAVFEASGGPLDFGQTIYITAVPFSGASATGVAGTEARLRGAYQTFEATKTLYYSSTSYNTLSGDAVRDESTGIITASSAGGVSAWVVVPEGVEITQVAMEFFDDAAGDANPTVTFVMRRAASDGTRTAIFTGGSFGGVGGWGVETVALSESTSSGRRYQLGGQIVKAANGKFRDFWITYDMPTPDKTV